MPPVIDQDKCTKCGKCVEVCPTDVFFGSKKGEYPTVMYPDECWHENACVLDCPVEGAIRVRIPLSMMMIYK
jgi:adenylylsulfate reductase subunit B